MEVCIAEVRPLVEDSYTHEQISEFQQQRDHEACGFSVRSVRKSCCAHNIHYCNISVQELDSVVHSTVGHSYGRCIMHGCWHPEWGRFLKEESAL